MKRLSRIWVAAALSGLLLTTVSCGAGESSGGSSQSSGASNGAVAAAAKQLVSQYTSAPVFTAPSKLTAFDAGKLKGQGKRVLLVPIGSQFDLAKSMINVWQSIFGEFDVTFDVYANQGTPTEWSAGVQQAITQRYDAIMTLGNNPRQFAPAIKEANNAGILVFDIFSQNPSDGAPEGLEVAGVTYSDLKGQSDLQAAWVTADSDGEGHILSLTSNDSFNLAARTQLFEDAVDQQCPDCTLKEISVPLNDWASKIQGEVQSALLTDPSIDYIVTCCDAMNTWVAPAVSAAGRADKVKVVGASGTPAALDALREGSPLVATVGEDIACISGIGADNVMRGLLGLATVENVDENGNAVTALRIFEESNVRDGGVPAEYGKGYGSSCIDELHEIWSGK